MKKKKPGFTLTEIVIVLAVTVIVLEITTSIFTTGNKVFSDSDVKTTLQIEEQTIQEKLSDIGMQADQLTIPDTIEENTAIEVSRLVMRSHEEAEGGTYNNIYWIITVDDSQVSDKAGKVLSIVKARDIDGSDIISSQEKIVKDIKSFKITCVKAAGKVSCIKFNIELSKKQGSKEVDYPIDFSTAFRNS
ncbi:type II secretion system protein [uncultured Clostridium sp.]|uniref:type II secretion system protein n=1 Tax=uncultured Clostridium sp. TaxID=59620 RepID=UPI0028E9A2DC|nr:type II secretion system protein [uncultured Clostridium sp.]